MCDPRCGTRKVPRGHTTRLQKAKTLEAITNAGVIKFPVNYLSGGLIEVFMDNSGEDQSNDGYCKIMNFEGKKVRLIDFSSNIDGRITVAGYWKGHFFPGKEDYEVGPTSNRWEKIQLIPEEDRADLEELLKKTYATVNFWK